MSQDEILSMLQAVFLVAIVLLTGYLLIVKLGAALTSRNEKDLRRLLFAAVSIIAIVMIFIEFSL